MEAKEFQFLFTKKRYGDSIIQLKDGKLLIYHFTNFYFVYIYNEKTFQKLFEINLFEIIQKFDEEIKNDGGLNGKERKRNEREYNFYDNSSSIKEISNGLILIGLNKYLIELKRNKHTYDCKIVKKISDSILDLNVLRNRRIIIITKKNIYISYKMDKEYIIKAEYLFKDDWKSVTKSNPSHYRGGYDEYFSSYILPNNRLLLYSFSDGYCFRRCGNAPPRPFSDSKITFIDLTNFEEIFSTKTFYLKAGYVVVKNYIIIQEGNNFTIYDINSLKIVKNINIPHIYGNIANLYDGNLIAFSKDEEGKKIRIYEIENNDLIEKCKVKGNLIFKIEDDKDELYDNRYLLALKDKRIIILCKNNLYIIRINDN